VSNKNGKKKVGGATSKIDAKQRREEYLSLRKLDFKMKWRKERDWNSPEIREWKKVYLLIIAIAP